jgi:dGTPase
MPKTSVSSSKSSRGAKSAKTNDRSTLTPEARHKIYIRLLNPVRLRKPKEEKKSFGLATLSDKSRIINSAPFRRLQGKAQVFSLARSGVARTRLTHSIEVSNYGELIAESIANDLVESGSLPAELRLAFVQTVENACLLHDIGNPPFGHMGEYAIGQWFRGSRPDLVNHWVVACGEIKKIEADRYLDAFESFDGNPQGLRIITRLQWLYDQFGMNLTCPLIGAYTKYISGRADATSRFKKKIGHFPSEAWAIKQTWAALELSTDADGMPMTRHPLVFIMEAADDIAYCLSDIEDALEMRLITETEFLNMIREDLEVWVAEAENDAKTKEKLTKNGTYHLFRLALSRDLVAAAAAAYIDNEDAILSGNMDTSLLGSKDRENRALKALKTVAADRIYTAREAVEIALGGLKAIQSILDAFKPMLLLRPEAFKKLADKSADDRFRKHPFEVLLHSLLPTKQMSAYQWQTENNPRLEPIHRTQLVIDYVSGMTDTHALKVYNIINGTGPTGIE